MPTKPISPLPTLMPQKSKPWLLEKFRESQRLRINPGSVAGKQTRTSSTSLRSSGNARDGHPAVQSCAGSSRLCQCRRRMTMRIERGFLVRPQGRYNLLRPQPSVLPCTGGFFYSAVHQFMHASQVYSNSSPIGLNLGSFVKGRSRGLDRVTRCDLHSGHGIFFTFVSSARVSSSSFRIPRLCDGARI